ncbi:hypothetical protein CO660_19315 [Rhizobium sp. L9]|nr:hypothetical protein CO660_19315 [Rhizobium sp. L9]
MPFSPAGRRCRQVDEGVSDERSECADRKRRAMNGVPCAPSSDPSGHLLPAGEKGEQAQTLRGRVLSLRPEGLPEGTTAASAILILTRDPQDRL